MDWDAIKADPVEFAEKLLLGPDGSPFRTFPAQANILRNIKRRTVLDTGRQFSKTTTLGIKIAHVGLTHSNWHICIVAPSLEQARIMFMEVEGYFQTKPLSSFVVGKIKQYPFPVITLKNGTRITARGANSPQFIRGNRFHFIVCDEAAFVRDATITDAIEPTMSVTGKHEHSSLVLASTPWGGGPFRDWYFEGQRPDADPDLAAFHYTSLDNPHIDLKFLENVRKRYGEDSLLYRTEYLGIFPDDDMAVFPWKDVQWATEHWPTEHEATIDGEELLRPISFPISPIPGHRYIQGVDLANLRDWFVALTLDNSDPQAIPLARMDRFQKRGWPSIKSTIRSNHHNYNRADTIIDATTLAESVVQDLDDISPEGYKFTGSTAKYEVVQELARMLSEHRLLLPPGERVILDELRYFEYDITSSKRITMEASQGHDDIVMALALGAHKASIPRTLGLFSSVSLAPPTTRKAAPTPPDFDVLFGDY